MTADYKEWIQNRADEIASNEYDKDFYELPENLRGIVYQRATADYEDFYASQIDAAREKLKYSG